MKIYFALIILSILIGTSYKTLASERVGTSLLDPVCKEMQYEVKKDCSSAEPGEEVIGCTFTTVPKACQREQAAECSYEAVNLNENLVEITITGDRGYFNFTVDKRKVSNQMLSFQETRHNSLFNKEVVAVKIEFDGSLKNPVELYAIEYGVNKLTGKKQESDKAHCQFRN